MRDERRRRQAGKNVAAEPQGQVPIAQRTLMPRKKLRAITVDGAVSRWTWSTSVVTVSNIERGGGVVDHAKVSLKARIIR